MSYSSITNSTVVPVQKYVMKEWVDSTQTNFFKKHVLARSAYLVLAPCYAISCALDAIVGLGAAFASICTLGLYRPALKSAEIFLESGVDILRYPYINLLSAINPNAKFIVSEKGPSYLEEKFEALMNHTIPKQFDFARKCANSDNILKRHVVSRLSLALIPLSVLVNSVAMAFFGMPAVVLSFLTVGKFSSINRIGQIGTSIPSLCFYVFLSVMGVISPQKL